MWSLEWNNLTDDEKSALDRVANYYACSCCDAGSMALDMFNAVVEIIKARDRAEIAATLGIDQ